MAEGEFGGAGVVGGEAGVVGEAGTRPEGELHAGLQVEEGDGSVFELGADDPFARQAKAVAVEAQ